MTNQIAKLIPHGKEGISKVIFALFIVCLIGFMACPLSIQLEPVEWWGFYDMIWYADDFTTDRFIEDCEEYANVYSSSEGLKAYGASETCGGLRYVFTTDWIIEFGQLGVTAISENQTCAIDVYIDDQLAGSFNGSKEMCFSTESDLPSGWIHLENPHQVEVKLLFKYYGQNEEGIDIVLSQLEFKAKVHKGPPNEETGTFTGKTFNASTNQAIEGVTVLIADSEAESKSDGSFRIENIKPDTYLVKFSKSGYEDLEGAVTIQSNEECEFQAYLNPTGVPVRTYGSLEGYITDSETGEPIEGADVNILKSLRTYDDRQTDSNGYYRIENIEIGTYRLLVLAKGYAPHDIDSFEIRANTKRYDISMGEGVSYPVPPGRGISDDSNSGDAGGNLYYPPVPPDYPTYVPTVRMNTPPAFPPGGPIYENPTLPAPTDGADYDPPPPGYTNSAEVPGAGSSTPAQNPVEQVLAGWQYIINWIRGLVE